MKGGPIGMRLPDGRIAYTIAAQLDVAQPYRTPLTLLRGWSKSDTRIELLCSTGRLRMLRPDALDFSEVTSAKVGRRLHVRTTEQLLQKAELERWSFAALYDAGDWRCWHPLASAGAKHGARALAAIEVAAARIGRAATSLETSLRVQSRSGARLRQEARADMTALQSSLAGARDTLGPERGTPLYTAAAVLNGGPRRGRDIDLDSWVKTGSSRSLPTMRSGLERATDDAARLISALRERLEAAARAAAERPQWVAEWEWQS